MARTSKPKKIENLKAEILRCIQSGRYRYTFHGLERFNERGFTQVAVNEVLINGRHEKSRDRYDDGLRRWSYSIRGKSPSEEMRELRVVVCFDKSADMLIITVVDLSKDEGR
jgi:hypothetical protein